jgi:hypothetical protein
MHLDRSGYIADSRPIGNLPVRVCGRLSAQLLMGPLQRLERDNFFAIPRVPQFSRKLTRIRSDVEDQIDALLKQ